jgi:hypothetical protein
MKEAQEKKDRAKRERTNYEAKNNMDVAQVIQASAQVAQNNQNPDS